MDSYDSPFSLGVIDAFNAAIKQVKENDSYSLSDIYVCLKYDEGSLCIYDDMERLLSQAVLTDPLKDSEEELVSLLKEILNGDPLKKELETLDFTGPFSVVLVDENYEQIDELITIDKDNILLEDDFFSKIDKDLDEFFEKLMSDMA
ncbi:MAG: hypothetical protein J1E02_07100 [Coprobacter sp.]|nr:hypothetical protein [Coprobacter sp.]